MAAQTKLFKKDADFNNQANIDLVYLTANKARLVFTALAVANLTQLNTLISTAGTGWNSIYQQSQNAAVCTASIINTKNLLRAQIEALLRAIFADIPKSVLTQIDRDTLDLPLPSDTRTAASKPSQTPSLSINGRAYLSVTINAIDTDFPKSLAKPAGVDTVQFEAAFYPKGTSPTANLPEDLEYRHLATIGKGSLSRTYTTDQLQGTEYVRARYLNSSKEPGNWSQPLSIIIS